MLDFGPKKWMKKKVHHYRLEAMFFFSKGDRKQWEGLILKKDHEKLGKEEKLFWVEDGIQFFSPRGEEKFERFVTKIAKNLGEKVFFDGDAEEFYQISKLANFYTFEKVAGDYGEVSYGLKEAEHQRILRTWSFSKKDLKESFALLLEELKLFGSWEQGAFILCDFLGVPWKVAEFEEGNKYFTVTINVQTLFAIDLEKKLLE